VVQRSLHRIATDSHLSSPSQGSPNTALVAGTMQDSLPRQCFSMTSMVKKGALPLSLLQCAATSKAPQSHSASV